MQPGLVVIGIAALGIAAGSDARTVGHHSTPPVAQSTAVADLNRQSLERASSAAPATAPAPGSPTMSAPPAAPSPNTGSSSAPPAGDSVTVPPGTIAPLSATPPTTTPDGPQPPNKIGSLDWHKR